MSVATRFILSKPSSNSTEFENFKDQENIYKFSDFNSLDDFMNFRDSVITPEQQQEYTYIFTDAQLDGKWTGYKRAEWANDSAIFTFITDDMLSARAFVQYLLANECIRDMEKVFLEHGWKSEFRMEPSNDDDLTKSDKIILEWPDNAVHIRPERFTS